MPLERDARAFGYEERAELGKHGRAGGGEEPFVAGRDHPVDYRGGRRKNDVIDAAAAASVAALAGDAGVLHRPPPQRGRCHGLGRHLAPWLAARGERVDDVPCTARTGAGSGVEQVGTRD